MRRMLEVLWDTGIRHRCPICEQGHLFRGARRMHTTCPHCSARFERDQGEEVGGMSISIVVTAIIFLTLYPATELLFEWPLWLHLGIWLPFSVIFPIRFYRTSRALWVAILHLSGSVYWDQEPYEESRLSITDAFFGRDEPEPPPLPDDEDASPHYVP